MYYPEDQSVFALPEVKEAWKAFLTASEVTQRAYDAYCESLRKTSE